MSSPVSILFNTNGVESNVNDNTAIPLNTTALLVAGSDGTNSYFLKTDNNGHLLTTVSGVVFSGTVTAGVEYTEGDVDATITGTAILMEAGGNTLVPVQGTVADGVLVNLGSNNDVTITGSVVVTNAGTFATQATQAGVWNITNVSGTVSLPTGAATEATLNSIKTAVELIDNTVSGSELQVDVITMPTVTVQATNLDIRDLVAATDSVTVHGDVGIVDQFDLANSNPLTVAIVDASGDQIVSFGGGTQYTEDAAAAANPVGTVPILVRADTPGTVTNIDGDNIAQRATNYGAAYVQVVSSAGAFVDTFGGGTQYTEGDVDSSITGTVMMMESGINVLVPAQGTPQDGLLVNLGLNNDVTASQTGAWNITNVSGTVSLPTGASTSALQTTGNTSLATLAGAVAGTEFQVDVLTLPAITGTVTANAGTNLNTSLLALETGGNLASTATSLSVIDDWDESDRAKVNPIVGQAGVQGASGAVSANTQRVVLATDVGLPAGSNSIGILGANSGVDIGDVTINNAAGAAAINIQDGGNVISVDDAGGSLTVDGTVTANAGTGTFSTQFNLGTTARITSASISAASSGDNTLISGTAGQTIRIFKIFLVVAAAVNIKFKTGSTDLTGLMNMTANGSFVLDYDSEPWFITADGENFVLNLSAAVQASGRIYYTKS